MVAALLQLALRGLVLGVPVDVGRDEARAAARRELAKQVYQEQRPGWLERLTDWLGEHLLRAFDRAAALTPGGVVGMIVIALVLVLVVVLIRLRIGPMARARPVEPLFTGRPRTAAEHRAEAEAHAAAGRWADAVRERLRAIVRGLEERALLDERPGRTADEAAGEAGTALPDCAPLLREAARLFDDIWYGGRPADQAAYALLREADQRVQQARRVAGARP